MSYKTVFGLRVSDGVILSKDSDINKLIWISDNIIVGYQDIGQRSLDDKEIKRIFKKYAREEYNNKRCFVDISTITI